MFTLCDSSNEYQILMSWLLIFSPIYLTFCDNASINNRDINDRLREALLRDKGTGCHLPKMDPFDKEVTQFDRVRNKIICPGMDWVRCHLSTCRVRKEILKTHIHIICTYQALIYDTDNYSHFNDNKYKYPGNAAFTLTDSDHAKVTCEGTRLTDLMKRKWSGYVAGYRKYIEVKHSPPGRENTFNVLMFGIDSVSKNGFIRRMPLSYNMLVKGMAAVVLDGYNIIGDGTPAALFPFLTGRNELELIDARKGTQNTIDLMPWIFYKLKDDGYRTAYYEDVPSIGTFQMRFNGWTKQPTDHYLRDLFVKEVDKTHNIHCVGDTQNYALMMNLTQDFFKLRGKKYCFTMVTHLSHNDLNLVQTADEDLVEFLKIFKRERQLEDTLLMVFADHGPRFAHVRETYLGKLEERHPLMAIILPEKLVQQRPEALEALRKNVDVLTTPHDIYATVLDVIDMRDKWNLYKVPGADLTRGLTLLEPIPASRSCSEAGVEPHWCTCIKWTNVSQNDVIFTKAAAVLVVHINNLTEYKRNLCLPRYLKSIEYVMKQQPNLPLLQFRKNKDPDGYLGRLDTKTNNNKEEFTVKITVGPGNGVFEASLTYLKNENNFIVRTRDIQRTNAYGTEPSCISDTYPRLNMFCYCKDVVQKLVNKEVVEKPVNKEVVQKLINKEVVEKPVSKEVVQQPVNQEVVQKPVNKEVVQKPVNKEVVQKTVNKEFVQKPVTKCGCRNKTNVTAKPLQLARRKKFPFAQRFLD